MFVDWRKYLCAESYLRSLLDTREITTLVILWDDSQVVPFCRRGKLTCMSVKCPGKMLENVVERVILMVPRLLCPEYVDCKPNDYKWIHLSKECKEHLRKKSLKLGGTEMQMIEIFESVCCRKKEDAEKFLQESFDEDDISILINRDSIDIGRPLHTMLMDRWKEMLHDHIDCFEPRVLKLRDMKLDRKFITARGQDASVFMYVEMSALEGLNLGSLPEWNCVSQRDTRCYSCSLFETLDEENTLIAKILNKLMCEALNFNKGWRYIHFFRLEGGKSVNLCSFKCNLLLEFSGEKLPLTFTGDSLLESTESNEALVLADAPGSGKTVFVNDLARRWKEMFSDSWVEVVDLSQFEELFSKLQTEIEVEEALHVLYNLVKESSNSIEEKVFKLFCGNRKKVFVFFDGFDEISQEYHNVVTLFLKTLVNTTLVQVVITTRCHECQHLEESLSTLAFSLVPFDRTQQVQFMRNEWIASLLMMPKQERREKIDTIASYLESLGNLNTEDKPIFFTSLDRLHPSRKNDSTAVHWRLDALAENLIASVKSNNSEEELTETPLHAWMLSSVAFEDNFNVLESISVSNLFHKFVDIKIRVFLREKEKHPKYKPLNATPLLVKDSVCEFLKTISAFYFTGDKEYEMNWNEKMVFLRVGLVSERQGRIVFVHQTFCEYFFSIWLLGKAETKKGTTLLLSSVLLLRKYETVRQFIDCLLHSENTSGNITLKGNTLTSTRKLAQMNRSVFPSSSTEITVNLQMCLYTCILECNRGILEFIYRNSGDYLQQIIFGETLWKKVSDDHSIYPLYHIGHISSKGNNAFCFLRQCLGDFLFRTPRKKTSYLMMLNKMLALSRDYDLTWRIDSLLERANLWWVGLEEYDLLRCEQGRKEFGKIFRFLIENKDALGNNLINILVKYGLSKLRTVVVFAFELFVYLLESISPDEEFQIHLLLGDDFHELFFRKVKSSRSDEVEEIWSFLFGKLTTEQKIDFLEAEKWNVLLAAFLNKVDESVLKFIWRSLKRELQTEKLKRLIFDAICDEPKHFPHKLTNEHGVVFNKWLQMVLSDSSITREEGIQILMTTVKCRGCFMFSHPSLVFAFQDNLLPHSHGSQILCDVEKRFYDRLANCCLITEKWCVDDFVEHVETEWKRLRPSLHKWFDYFLDEDNEVSGYLRHVRQEGKRHRIPLMAVKAYVVLLEKQFILERTVFGNDKFVRRVVDSWKFEERDFPIVLCLVCDDWKKTASVFVGLFFGVLASFVSMSVVEQMLKVPTRDHVEVLAIVQSMMRFVNNEVDLQRLAAGLDREDKDISATYTTFEGWLALGESDSD